MVKKRKCKTCGRLFVAAEKGERFCSALCRTTGNFVAGGGDTSKPNSMVKAIIMPKAEKTAQHPIEKTDAERFARVREMFGKPASERWAMAQMFTKEEAEYARRLARRKLMEEARIVYETEWDAVADEETEDALALAETFCDSDDGTV